MTKKQYTIEEVRDICSRAADECCHSESNSDYSWSVCSFCSAEETREGFEHYDDCLSHELAAIADLNTEIVD